MFCATCNAAMNESTTKLKVPGKENPAEVTSIPCSICPVCHVKVIDSVTMTLVEKIGQKSKDSAVDFEKVRGISIIAGKL